MELGGRKVTSQQGDREKKKSEGANGRVQREVRVLYRLSFYSVNTEVTNTQEIPAGICFSAPVTEPSTEL